LEFVEKWGVSISFLLFFGLLINSFLFNLDYKTPLATIPLLISFNIAFIVLVAIGYKVNKEPFFSLPNLNLSASEKAFLIVPILFPALSIFGMRVMNTTDNNIFLMFLLFLIPTYVVFVCFFNQKFPKRFYPVVIFSISISLLLLLSLRSNHLIGMDVHSEYYFFRRTLDNLHWSVSGHSPLDACLTISLLPTIYQSILGIPSEFLYKTIPSVLCSVFPLVIYVISKKYIGEFYAFLASMYFMSNNSFLWTEYNARAITAMLFFAFAMMTLFNDRIEPLKKRMLFIVFMASCMVSHYSSTYTFFFVMLATCVGIEMLSKKYTFKKVVGLTTVILFFAFIFFWYSQVTEAAFNSGVNFVEKTFNTLFNFAAIEATWITFAFIGIGVATLIRKYKEMSFPELNFKKPDFLKDKFEVVYFVLVLACSGLLVAILVIPHLSKGYGLGRAYPLASTLLSVFFVIGAIIISKYFFFFTKRKHVLKKKTKSFTKRSHYQRNNGKNRSQVWAYVIILLVLIPYFLCVTGAMYNIFGVPRDITLNSEGEQYDGMYIHDQESYGAKWLGKYMQTNSRIYTDHHGGSRVVSQTKITSIIDYWSLVEHKKISGYIYLRYYNVINEKLIGEPNVYNMTEYLDIFDEKNRIYANGGSEIYR
jgi:uncharacterized membrane protein